MNIAPKYRWLICGLYAAGILFLSILPAGALAGTWELFLHQDKVLHALTYGGWAALMGWALQRQLRRRPAARLLAIVLTTAAYGALMEILQGSLAGIQRDCSWGDALANLAGAIAGVGLFALCILNLRPSVSGEKTRSKSCWSE